MEKKYTIKSVSDEGVYYLVNGWNKCKTFWFSEESVLKDVENAKRFFFNKPSQAKASLTKLLKVMEDYRNDIFEVVEFYSMKTQIQVRNGGKIMLENIWRYSINEGEAGGIVIANTKERAEQKVKEMYEDYDGSENADDEIIVWKAILDDDYSKDYPDVLEIY